MMILCFSLYENKFKKKPLPSLSSRKGLTNCSLITSFDLIMNVELGFLQARSVVVYLWKGFCRKAWVRRWWNGKLVFKFQHLAYTTISKKWKPLKMFSRFFFNLQPKVIDRADAVNEVGASEWAKEIIAKLASRWGERLFVLISFARLRTGASALYFLVYEWILSERE